MGQHLAACAGHAVTLQESSLKLSTPESKEVAKWVQKLHLPFWHTHEVHPDLVFMRLNKEQWQCGFKVAHPHPLMGDAHLLDQRRIFSRITQLRPHLYRVHFIHPPNRGPLHTTRKTSRNLVFRERLEVTVRETIARLRAVEAARMLTDGGT